MMSGSAAATGPLIALADDHPIVRGALRATLETLEPGVRFVEAASAAEALALAIDRPELDLMLMDLAMPGADGAQAIRTIRHHVPALPLAIVSAAEDAAAVADLLALGVSGFIPKSESPPVIRSAVRLILDGGTYAPARFAAALERSREAASPAGRLGLTERQWDVLRLLGDGKSNKMIARELGITEGTVKVHLLAVYRVLDVRNRTAAVLAAQRGGAAALGRGIHGSASG